LRGEIAAIARSLPGSPPPEQDAGDTVSVYIAVGYAGVALKRGRDAYSIVRRHTLVILPYYSLQRFGRHLGCSPS